MSSTVEDTQWLFLGGKGERAPLVRVYAETWGTMISGLYSANWTYMNNNIFIFTVDLFRLD